MGKLAQFGGLHVARLDRIAVDADSRLVTNGDPIPLDSGARAIMAGRSLYLVDESTVPGLRFSPGGRPGWQMTHQRSGGALYGWCDDETDLPILADLYRRLGDWDRPYELIQADERMWPLYGEFTHQLALLDVPVLNPHLAAVPMHR